MALLFDDQVYAYTQLTQREEKAWKLYCEESAGMLSAKDYWQQLPVETQHKYLERVRHA